MAKVSAARHRASSGEPLRAAVVGAGKMAGNHLRAMQSLDALVRVVGVADPSAAAREAMLARFPEVSGHADLAGLLEREQVEVVHVCTPMESHAEVAQEALEAGCHVYVEKPVTPDIESLERVMAMAEAEGRLVCAGHQVLYERPYRRLLELMPLIGRPVHAESYFSFRPIRTARGNGKPLSQEEQLLDVLPHPSYLLLDLFERLAPEERSADLLHLEVSGEGNVHGLLRRGGIVGSIVVTLEGRPVEHWLRVVGANGTVHADFVRGTVQEFLGPGTSGIDKALNPFRQAIQLGSRTSAALGRRIYTRGAGYPGLEGIFAEFYRAIRSGSGSPTSPDQIHGTVRLGEAVRARLQARSERTAEALSAEPVPSPRILVTGGTGLLGREVVRALRGAGHGVRVVSRRIPSSAKWVSGVDYRAADLAAPLPDELFEGIGAVVHCAAETAGGWDQHRRNSVRATENLLRAASAAAVETFVHVSSVAVLSPRERDRRVRDDDPLHPDPESLGPYAWGKAESERVVTTLATGLGLRWRVLRPAPLVDSENFEPPGRLGRRVGNVYVAVGGPAEALVVGDVSATANAVAAVALAPETAPPFMNLIPADPPTRRDLVRRLRSASPEVSVVWLPRAVLFPLSWAAVAAQKVLRPRSPAVRVAPAFAGQRFEPGPAVQWMSTPLSPYEGISAGKAVGPAHASTRGSRSAERINAP